jgi:glyoxylate/hydroxypyruvate reductase A
MRGILFHSEFHDPVVWKKELEAAAGKDLDLRFWPDIGDPSEIEVLLTWTPPEGWQKLFPNLKLLQCLGAGVDHLLSDPIPSSVQVTRIAEEGQIEEFVAYVCAGVLQFHREFHVYREHQNHLRWMPNGVPSVRSRTVGVMGLGSFGSACARQLVGLGFNVRGWSRSLKELERVKAFAGDLQLNEFLAGAEILVCVLPLTDSTREILDAKLFYTLPPGACIINVGRGEHCVEKDLVDAVSSKHLGGALLDAFRVEPLPPSHPFWTTPGINITPHIATRAKTGSAAALTVENLRRLDDGRPLVGLVDTSRGY